MKYAMTLVMAVTDKPQNMSTSVILVGQPASVA